MVFHSNKQVAKAIRRFFKQGQVRDFIKPLTIQFVVIPPKQLANDDTISLWTHVLDRLSHKTTCGLPLIAALGSQCSWGTLGGVVLVDERLFSMTSRHLLSQLISSTSQDLVNDDVRSETSLTDDGTFSYVNEVHLTETEVEEDCGPYSTTLDEGDLRHQIASVNPWTLESFAGSNDLDWTLMSLETDFWLPNLVDKSEIQVGKSVLHDPKAIVDLVMVHPDVRPRCQDVLVLSGHGLKPGILNTQRAFLLPSGGSEFVETFTLTPNKE
ncbi:Uu.00g088680.m01.CDS01 [Anthostomella pinea]|uniref:Uu.00g088680.m01.CDS01 n=1 Tax=Anthostomella pinea TaxID=933095 RepID=A0AAI8YK50_9PEZI|nr:Uu.00g088680.m01.CDS01 [Anthostomella pinea]